MIHLIPILFLLAGCAGLTQPPLPDFHTMRQAQTIDLPGHSAEAITEAVMQMFTLADQDDVVMHPLARGLMAERRIYRSDTLIYVSITTERYEFDIADGRVFMAAALRHADVSTYPYSTDVYDLIRARIRHLLGENEPWVSCEDMTEYSSSSLYHHPYLCLYADDHRPE